MQEKQNSKILPSDCKLVPEQSDGRIITNEEENNQDEQANIIDQNFHNSTSFISRRSKIIVVAILVSLTILGLLIFAIIFLANFQKENKSSEKKNNNFEEQNINSLNSVSNSLNSVSSIEETNNANHSSAYIFTPQYEQNQVFHINYSISNIKSQEQLVRVNYTVYFVTAKIEQDQNGERIQTNFQASVQKRTEEKIFTNNQTIEQVKFYDNSTRYDIILKNGIDFLDDQDVKEAVDSNLQNFTCQEMYNQTINQSIICQQPLLWVFNFTLLANGKIKQLTFPLKMEKIELALLRTFIKMFSPLLEKNAYQDGTPQTKIRNLQSNYFGDNTQSSTYEQSNNYTYDGNQTNGIFSEKAEVTVTSDIQNTEQLGSQQIAFQGGKPSFGSIQSQTLFLYKTQQYKNRTDQTSLFDPEPIQLRKNYISKQKCQFKVIEIFSTSNLQDFASFLANYKEENQTLTTNVQGLIYFILEGNAQSEMQQMIPGNNKVLLKADGSLKIIGFYKTVTLAKTNIIGFKIAVFGYFQLDIKVQQNIKNILKKDMIFRTDVGTILSLGNNSFKHTIYEYEQKLQSLNLKFTLEKIQFALDLLKGDFISNIQKFSKAIFSGHLQLELLPELASILSVINNLIIAIGQEKNKYFPIQKINEIYSIIKKLEEAYQSKGLSLLNKENITIVNLENDLLKYSNKSYEEAWNIFVTHKNSLKAIRQNSISFFINASSVFLNQTIKQVTFRIENMISKQIQEKYEQEIQKIKIIFEMIQYYETESSQYIRNITQLMEKHEQNFLKTIQNVLDLYFQNQTKVFNDFQGSFLNSYEKHKQVYQNYISKLKEVSSFINEKIVNAIFQKNLGSEQYRQNFTNYFDNLALYANNSYTQRYYYPCCKRQRSFWGALKCKQWNDAYSELEAIPSYWSHTQKIIKQSIICTTQKIEFFFSIVKELIYQKTLTPKQKIYQIVTIYDNLVAKYPLNKTLIADAIFTCKSQAQNALNLVRCGSTGNLTKFIQVITELQSFFSLYYDLYDRLSWIRLSILDESDIQVSNQLQTYSKLTASTIEFMEDYSKKVTEIQNNFIEFQNIARSFSAQSFVSDSREASKIFQKYEDTMDKLDQLCQINSTAETIDRIRQEYKDNIKKLSQIKNQFFADEIQKVTELLSNASIDIFDSYKNIPFCQFRQQFQQKLSALYPDFENFTILYRLWSNFTEIKVWNEVEIQKFKDYGQQLKGNLLQLFKPEEFDDFIKGINQKSFQFINFVENLGMKLSFIKEESKSVLIFQTAAKQQLQNCYLIFLESNFTMNIEQMFLKIQQFTDKSLQVIQNFNFDVITVVVAAKNIQQHFKKIIQNYQSGISKVSQNFKDLCSKFIQLDKLATLDYLIELDQKFSTFFQTINETIFPNFTEGIQKIRNKFSGYHFTNQNMRQQFTKIMDTQFEYIGLVNQQKEQLNRNFHQIYNQASQLIDILQIDSLSSLYYFSKSLKKLFEKFFQNLKNILHKINDLPHHISSDFRYIFKLDWYLNEIKNEVKELIQKAKRQMQELAKSTFEQLKKNPNFYNKFQNSSIYSSVQTISKEGLKVNIGQLWADPEATYQIYKIKNIVKQLSVNIQQLLEKISEIQHRAKNIKFSIQEKIKIIKISMAELKRKLFNLQNLIFININEEFRNVIMLHINVISNNIDLIVTEDLASLTSFPSDIIHSIHIQQLLSMIISKYSQMKQIKGSFLIKTDNALRQMNQFIKTKLSQKIQKLKDGSVFVRSKTNMMASSKSVDLYRIEELQRVPISTFYQIIPTLIGTYKLGLKLNYILDCQVIIQISQFRNVIIKFNLSASIEIDISFSSRPSFIYQVGLFAKGNILRGQLKPMFILTNFIPFQFIQAITGIESFQKFNKIDAYFIVDMSLYAVQVTVGYYYRRIGCRVIYKIVKQCFRVSLWRKQCRFIKIPIAFSTGWVTYIISEQKIPGIVLAQKRIVDLHFLSLKY